MCFRASLIAIVFLFSEAPVRAVILYGTGDPAANTNAPAGNLANSGWQYEGQFGSFLGTAIASNYFVTAKHIGGSVGQTFTFNDVAYTTTAVFPDPSSDLQVWQVSGTFPTHAPLFANAPETEVGLSLVVFGRGTQRGNSVLVGNDSHLGGWLWGASDGVQRWGTNVVESIYTDPGFGKLVRATFDNNPGSNEAHLSAGDSGGAVFVFNSTTNRWELAGINLGVDGPFSFSMDGSNTFNAAMFDTTGLFVDGGDGTWVAAPNPSAFYATEIAAHRRFVESVVMQLTGVVSRKTHGDAGTFDVNLPSSGSPGIECRSGGAASDYMLVFAFANTISVQSATVTAGTGSATNFTVVANVVTVNLTGVANAQTITVTLGGVNNGTNTGDVEAAMSVLIGDTTANGAVNSSDVAQTQAQAGQAVTAANAREDVTANGEINSSDIGLVQSQSGTALSTAAALQSPMGRSPRIIPLPNQRLEIDRTPVSKWNRFRKNQ
ncbi:MAG TPA: hypothetical protein VLK27_01180 [Chthoniobacterales bacterium]|nr:hypothetical protein [Chthoniobacterales bacterium]